ncbi:MAG TPA: hypothetical protein VIO80_04540 [Candidatus Dormibacteraeota bacterium]
MAEDHWERLVHDGMAPAHKSGEELSYWVRQYPGRLVPLPPDAWELSDYGRVDDEADTWWVVVPLWTSDGGRSDLSLEATIRERLGHISLQVDNVHVL